MFREDANPACAAVSRRMGEQRRSGRAMGSSTCLRSSARTSGGSVHEIGSRARVRRAVEGDRLTLAVTCRSGEEIVSCPRGHVSQARRSLAARRRSLRGRRRPAAALGLDALRPQLGERRLALPELEPPGPQHRVRLGELDLVVLHDLDRFPQGSRKSIPRPPATSAPAASSARLVASALSTTSYPPRSRPTLGR